MKARDLYEKACNGGVMMGCLNIGDLEFKAGNKVEATQLYKKACDGGEKKACEKLSGN